MSPYITDIKIINEIFYIFVFLLSLACIFAFSVSQVGPGPIQVRCGHVGPAGQRLPDLTAQPCREVSKVSTSRTLSNIPFNVLAMEINSGQRRF